MQRTYQFAEIGPTRAEGAIFDLLITAGRRHGFADGAQLIHRGDQAKGFWLIATGHVMACRFGREGERILYGVLGPGDLIGELACFGGVTQQVNAIAEGDVEAVWLDIAQMDQLLSAEPQLARWLLDSVLNESKRYAADPGNALLTWAGRYNGGPGDTAERAEDILELDIVP